MLWSRVDRTEGQRRLRQRVRSFVHRQREAGTFEPGLGLDAGISRPFSKLLGENGFVGWEIDPAYGGQGGTTIERFIIAEELLAGGCPVLAHWVADRQIAPSIARFGTEEQRKAFLPAIARGECLFSLGLSEPDVGSDLASVRTRAVRSGGGWVLNGRKIWTTGAEVSDYILVLCRTREGRDKRDGLSQLIVPLDSPGLEVSSIAGMGGERLFNEVVFTDVEVPPDGLLGTEGRGWEQVTQELVLERAGPERYMTPFLVLETLTRWLAEEGRHGPNAQAARHVARSIAPLVAELLVIREMAFSVAAQITRGGPSGTSASIVKDIATDFEQRAIDTCQKLTTVAPDPEVGSWQRFLRLQRAALLSAPTVTLRGGTTEILRVLIARDIDDRRKAG